MTIGSGLAMASIWLGTSFIVWTFRKDMSPFAVVVCLAIACGATAYAAGVKP